MMRLHILAVVALCAGCAPASDMVEVSGEVTWNGMPVPNGMIVLQPVDPKTPPAGGQIRDGKYQLRSKPGKMRVQIEAVRATNQVDPATGTPLGEMYIPARYNTQTSLEAEISSDGANRFDFPLQEKN
jgi:hypothetical protein